MALLARRGTGQAATTRPGGSAAVRGLGAIDPRFIIQPRTVTEHAQAGRLLLALTVSPLVPGANTLTISISDHGRAVPGARVQLLATMPDMQMNPLSYVAREVDAHSGRYVTTADLAMYGSWLLPVRVDRGSRAPVTHVFHLDISFPPALLQAVATREATQ